MQLPFHLRDSTVLSPRLAQYFWRQFSATLAASHPYFVDILITYMKQYKGLFEKLFALMCTVLTLERGLVGRSQIAVKKKID